jgi:hypothetical protein
MLKIERQPIEKKSVKKDKWRLTVLSPVNMKRIWSHEAKTTRQIAEKWFDETGNDYISQPKLIRASVGRSKNPYFILERIEVNSE